VAGEPKEVRLPYRTRGQGELCCINNVCSEQQPCGAQQW
jgi:hypothetical protein